MSITKLPGSAIKANTITTTQLQTTVVNQITAGGGPRVTSLIYPGNDTAGNTAGGQTVYINGSGFETNNAIYINGNAVPSKAFISASNLSFTTPALSAGIYPVYVINTDTGATAIFVPGYISSAEPTWVTGSTLSEVGASDAWSISLSVTGDTPITYALANGSSLPSGISLAANGLISGTLSSPPETNTQYTFTVVATDVQNQDASRQFTITTSVGEGLPFANNVLLIHADGTNNGNNHSFLDSSNNNFTITRNGNATQGSFSPFSQTGWSAYFDGNGDFLTFTNQTTTGAFTCECWFYRGEDVSGYHIIFGGSNGGSANPNNIQFYVNNNGAVGMAMNGVVDIAPTGTAVAKNKWNHIAWVRSGTSVAIFVNGSRIATGTTSATLNVDRIGSSGGLSSGSYDARGYISNARIAATAVYNPSSTTYTVPTSPLTAISGTYLLTLQNNRFIDNSASPLTITRNGDVSIQAFSPFAPTAAYSTANVGGSGYFDGSGDYLSAGSSTNLALGSGDFTIECYIYLTSRNASTSCIWDYRTNGLTPTNIPSLFLSATGIPVFYSTVGVSAVVTGSSAVPLNSWNHLALVRNGSTVTMYLNGTSIGSATSSINFGIETFNINDPQGNFGQAGYYSNFRIVKGTAVYTAGFTPPTAPVTNIANTSLLLNFTNAQIFDQTAKNVLETVGDAKVSTAQYKYGTASIYLDGNGDWLKIPRSALFDFGTGDFTVETWVRFNTVGVDQAILAGDGTTGGYDILYRTGIGLVIGRYNTAFDNTFAWSPSINTWYHIAWCRSGSSLRAFVDGTQIGTTVTNTNAYNGGAVFNSIGTSDNGSNRLLNGYLDDLRVTKGYARYTSNFTPPTSALKDK